MKTIAELNEIKAKMLAKLGTRDGIEATDTRIVIGMATCGIAAGARPVFNSFLEEVTRRNLSNVKVSQSGCLGMCKLEPMVQIFVPNQEVVTYVKVTEEMAKDIVSSHIVNGNILTRFVIEK